MLDADRDWGCRGEGTSASGAAAASGAVGRSNVGNRRVSRGGVFCSNPPAEKGQYRRRYTRTCSVRNFSRGCGGTLHRDALDGRVRWGPDFGEAALSKSRAKYIRGMVEGCNIVVNCYVRAR